MSLTWPFKDPDEVLDYALDWSARIEDDDEIVSSTWIVPDGITKDSDELDAEESITTIWLSGGTLNETYSITNRIVTSGGRTMDQTVRLKIKAK